VSTRICSVHRIRNCPPTAQSHCHASEACIGPPIFVQIWQLLYSSSESAYKSHDVCNEFSGDQPCCFQTAVRRLTGRLHRQAMKMETETVLQTSDNNLLFIWLNTWLCLVAVELSNHMLLLHCLKIDSRGSVLFFGKSFLNLPRVGKRGSTFYLIRSSFVSIPFVLLSCFSFFNIYYI
jgi:hypothetical protein